MLFQMFSGHFFFITGVQCSRHLFRIKNSALCKNTMLSKIPCGSSWWQPSINKLINDTNLSVGEGKALRSLNLWGMVSLSPETTSDRM